MDEAWNKNIYNNCTVYGVDTSSDLVAMQPSSQFNEQLLSLQCLKTSAWKKIHWQMLFDA